MNAAARLLNQSAVSRSWVLVSSFTKTHLMLFILSLTLLTSALSIVYVTNASRSLNATIQQTIVERNRLHVQWGQLLLEKSMWITPLRVQNFAEEKLNMLTPENKSVIIVTE